MFCTQGPSNRSVSLCFYTHDVEWFGVFAINRWSFVDARLLVFDLSFFSLIKDGLMKGRSCFWPHLCWNKEKSQGFASFQAPQCHRSKWTSPLCSRSSWSCKRARPDITHQFCFSFRLCLRSGVHQIREVLRVQCSRGRQVAPHHHEGGDGERPGDHAGHPAGWVPSSVGGHG